MGISRGRERLAGPETFDEPTNGFRVRSKCQVDWPLGERDMKGKCLCGLIEFELDEPVPDLYQCHCSLCRRVSGSSANAALRIPAAQFRWLGGEQEIGEFQTDSGFRSHFCRRCGSPVPNATAGGTRYWVPAGLLDDSGEIELGAHLYIASRASWDIIAETGEQYAEMPDPDILDDLLERGRG